MSFSGQKNSRFSGTIFLQQNREFQGAICSKLHYISKNIYKSQVSRHNLLHSTCASFTQYSAVVHIKFRKMFHKSYFSRHNLEAHVEFIGGSRKNI